MIQLFLSQVYHISVCREGSKPAHIFRRYREFHEMHTKLFQSFSDAPLPQLPGKVLVRHKSLSKQVCCAILVPIEVFIHETNVTFIIHVTVTIVS